MTLANRVPGAHATELPERTTGEMVRPWHELDYARLLADSDRILADALTPQAVVLLHRVGTERAGVPRLNPPASPGWTVSAVPPQQIRATQRSPPRHRQDTARPDRIVREVRRGERSDDVDDNGTGFARGRQLHLSVRAYADRRTRGTPPGRRRPMMNQSEESTTGADRPPLLG